MVGRVVLGWLLAIAVPSLVQAAPAQIQCRPIINPSARLTRPNLEKLTRLKTGGFAEVNQWLGAPYCLRDKGNERVIYYPFQEDTSVWIVLIFKRSVYQSYSLVIGQEKP